MITAQHRESLMQQAHIYAVAARAGANMTLGQVFDYGCDGTFVGVTKLPDGSMIDNGAKLDFQLKATTKATFSRGHDKVSFVLDVSDYNKMIERTKSWTPFMLILLVLPKDETKWASFSKNNTILRRCCFWKNLRGEKRSDNKSNVTVSFPLKNILTPDVISNILKEIVERNTQKLDDWDLQVFGGQQT